MASTIKSKLLRTSSAGGDDNPGSSQETDKYRLVVSAGPSYDQSQHKPVLVNTEQPTFVENSLIRAKIIVRVRGFRGLPSSCPSTSPSYFDDPLHRRDQYSIAFSFVPKRDIPSLHTVWGNDLDHPIRDRIPPGFNTAFRIVKEFIDPGLSCDVTADQPWLYGPSLSCWFAFRIGDLLPHPDADFPAPHPFSEGADGSSGAAERSSLNLPDDPQARRKFFLSPSARETCTFRAGRVYTADFFNPYLDFARCSLRLPGFSLSVLRYIGEKTHTLRYVFKDREKGDLFLNVNFTLLWGEELDRALQQDSSENVAFSADGAQTEVRNDAANPTDAPTQETTAAASS